MKYRPSNVAPARFDDVRAFVVQAILDYRPANAQLALTLASTLSSYVLWATTKQNAPLDRDDIFYPSLFDQFLRTKGYTAATRNTMRARLYRLANVLVGLEYNRKTRVPRNVPVAVFTPAELAELESWAATQYNARQRRAAAISLALFAGAGLYPREVLQVQGRHITTTPEGRTVTVTGKLPRDVPIDADWNWYLDAYVDSFTPDEFVFSPKGTLRTRENNLKNLYHINRRTFGPRRIRDHWVVKHLQRLPLPVVLHIAGMGDETALRRYIPAIKLTDTTSYEAQIRNTNGATR